MHSQHSRILPCSRLGRLVAALGLAAVVSLSSPSAFAQTAGGVAPTEPPSTWSTSDFEPAAKVGVDPTTMSLEEWEAFKNRFVTGVPNPQPQAGGEDAASAVAIASLPFVDTGNTCLFVDDYDETCPYPNSTSPDAVYSFTPATDIAVDVSLCNSSYDTKLFVYENAVTPGAPFACNDDACSGPNFPQAFLSRIEDLHLTAGNTYYFVVDGWNGDCGNYEISVTETACSVICPAGATLEGEPRCGTDYTDLLNGGCNAAVPVFSNLACTGSEIDVCGEFGGFQVTTSTGNRRDTDWYQLIVPPGGFPAVTISIRGEHPALMGYIDGNLGCATPTFIDAVTTPDCGSGSITVALPEGPAWFFVAPAGFGSSLDCSGDYQLNISGLGCASPDADLALTKSVDNPTPVEGSSIVYSLSLSNGGPGDASGVAVTDLLPTGVTYVTSTASQGAYDSGTGLWTVGAVLNGASATLNITATVDAGTAGSTIVNMAAVSASDQTDPNAANDSDSANITVQSVDVAVTKTVDDATPIEGATINYTIVAANAGPDGATGVTLTDVLPAGVTFVSSVATQGTYDDGTGVWTLGAIAAAAADTLTVTATVDAGTAGTSIDNTASLTAVDQTDANAANDSGSANITVQSVDVAVTKTVDDATPIEGATINYTIVAANAGPDGATGVTLTDVLPAGVTFVSSVATQGTYDDGTGVWTLGAIAAAAADTLTVTATVDVGTAGTSIDNTASLTAVDQTDANAANDSGSANITVQATIDLAVAKSVDDATPVEGGTVTFTIDLSNAGPDAATGVEVTDVLPTGLTFLSSPVTQGTYDSGTGVWDVGTVNAGNVATLVIVALVDAGTSGQTIVNTAAVSAADQGDANTANDSDDASVTVEDAADLALTKTVDDVTPIPGTSITYTLTMTNNGPGDAAGIEVTDLLPTGVTYQSSLASQGSYSAGSGLWTIGSVNAGNSVTLDIVATIDAASEGLSILNTATITAGDGNDPNPTNSTDSANLQVRAAVSKAITSGSADDQRPSWSPSGTEIAFDSDRSGNLDVWTMTSSGGSLLQLTTSPLVDQHPDWSPDGTEIAFIAPPTAGAPLDLYVIPSSGGVPSILASDGSEIDRFPNWSPDGTLVAYAKGGDIYVVAATGGAPVQVTTDPANDTHPTWSPDGTQLAFLSNRSGNNDIWIIQSTGGVATQITTDSGNDGGPEWSPDGKLIAFQSSRNGNNDLFLVPVSGGPEVQITFDSAAESQPDWAPDGRRLAFNRAGDIVVLDFVAADQADLAITKTVDDGTPNEGQTIQYEIVLQNNGPGSATGIDVNDLLPVGVTFVSASASQGTYSAGSGLWSVGTLPPSSVATITIDATIDSGTGATTIVNTATIAAVDQVDPFDTNDSASASVSVKSVDLALSKSVDAAIALPGTNLTYTIVVENLGVDAASSVAVADLLPLEVSYQSSSASTGSYDDGLGVWSIGPLTSGASDTLTIQVTVLAGTSGLITNTATVSATEADSNPSNNTDDAVTDVQFSVSEFQVTNTVASEQRPSWAPSGTEIAFDSNVNGNTDLFRIPDTGGSATQITVSTRFDVHADWSPDGLTIAYAVPLTGTNDISLIPAAGGTPVTLEADSLANDRFPAWSPDGSMIAFTKDGDIYVIPATGGTAVAVTTDPANDAHPTWSPDGTTIGFLSNRSGNNDIWTIPVGGGSATQITTDPANDGAPDWSPDGTSFVFQSNRSGNNDLWLIPAAGGSAVQLTTHPGVDVQPDWSPAGNRIAFARDGDIWTLTLGASGSADVAIAKTVDQGTPAEGATIRYEIVVSNDGPDVATALLVSDVLPTGVTYVGASATQGSYASASGLWTVPTLAVGQSDTLSIDATVDFGTNGQTIVNFASLAGIAQSDPDLSDNSSSAAILVTTVVSSPDRGLPTAFALAPCRPNPFRGEATLSFDVPTAGRVSLTIYDVAGRMVSTVLDEHVEPGSYRPRWDGRDASGRLVSPGIYFVRLTGQEVDLVRKVVRLR